MGWFGSDSPPYSAEVFHQLGLELGALVGVYLLRYAELTEYVLICSYIIKIDCYWCNGTCIASCVTILLTVGSTSAMNIRLPKRKATANGW